MKISRNEPCHCGSGIKYKKCHGATITKTRRDTLRDVFIAIFLVGFLLLIVSYLIKQNIFFIIAGGAIAVATFGYLFVGFPKKHRLSRNVDNSKSVDYGALDGGGESGE